MTEPEEIVVGIGEIAVSHNPTTLSALGLGSCVGVALYDKEAKIGGLAHIMLPDSREYAGKISENRDITKLTRYADMGIPKMIEDMEKLGAKKSAMHAKIAGGAQMFPGLESECTKIGQRNVLAVKKVLQQNNIPLDAEDVGGNSGRSIKFCITDQTLRIKTIKDTKQI